MQVVDESTGKQHVLASNLANITLFGTPLLNGKPFAACPQPAAAG